MSPTPTLLKVLLTRRHWQKYETFRAEYEKTARRTAPELMNTAPSKAQYYRWLAGQLKGLYAAKRGARPRIGVAVGVS